MKISPRVLEPKQYSSEEFRVYGPPGTGKTTWLVNHAGEMADTYGIDQVSVCSLTKSAVSEVSGRDLTVADDNVSTLHARCKRALQAPAPAETKVSDFLKVYPHYLSCFPQSVSRVKADEDDSSDQPLSERLLSGNGTIYDYCQIFRQQMVDPIQWAPPIREFFFDWNNWCQETNRMDFTGWLEAALELRPLPSQQVVFVDEAQDHTPLQLEVLRRWNAKKLILIGDDDQNLYEWAGAIPRHFFNPPLAADHESVLAQSYRVPKAVHRVALNWICQASSRKEKIYHPRDEEGSCSAIRYNLDAVLDERLPEQLEDQIYNKKQTVMFLTSCGYMLDNLIALLKAKRIPFYNPYRRSNAVWNPLQAAGTKVWSFIVPKLQNRLWTGNEASLWVQIMRSEAVFNPGRVKDRFLDICQENFDDVLDKNIVSSYIRPKVLDAAFAGDTSFMKNNKRMTPGSWDYVFDIFDKPRDLWTPRVIVGTIHSVKAAKPTMFTCFRIYRRQVS